MAPGNPADSELDVMGELENDPRELNDWLNDGC